MVRRIFSQSFADLHPIQNLSKNNDKISGEIAMKHYLTMKHLK